MFSDIECSGIISDDLTMKVLHGPLEVVVGVIYGTIVGLILWIVPNKKHVSYFTSCETVSNIILLFSGYYLFDNKLMLFFY